MVAFEISKAICTVTSKGSAMTLFKAGDRVHHIGRREDGTVIESNTTGVVRVAFDNPTPSGNRSVGEFDEIWFNGHPGWLKLIGHPSIPLQHQGGK